MRKYCFFLLLIIIGLTISCFKTSTSSVYAQDFDSGTGQTGTGLICTGRIECGKTSSTGVCDPDPNQPFVISGSTYTDESSCTLASKSDPCSSLQDGCLLENSLKWEYPNNLPQDPKDAPYTPVPNNPSSPPPGGQDGEGLQNPVPPVAQCTSDIGKCIPNNASSSCGNVDFSFSCGSNNAVCCLSQNTQCSSISGAQCTTASSCTGQVIDSGSVSCGGGGQNSGGGNAPVCCLQNGSSNAQKSKSTGNQTSGGSGLQCSNSKVVDETFNQCGCSADGVTIAGSQSVKVEKFHYSNPSCPTGDQFACGTAKQCQNGCSGGVCKEDQPKSCQDGRKPGDTQPYHEVNGDGSQCKDGIDTEGPDCSPVVTGKDGKTPITQVPWGSCDTSSQNPSAPVNDSNKGTSKLCVKDSSDPNDKGAYHCDACNIPNGQSVGTQTCYRDTDNQACLTQSCSNQSDNPIFTYTCTNTPQCTDPAPSGLGYKYAACSSGAQCTGVGGGSCGYCQTPKAQTVSVESTGENVIIDATSWIECASSTTCLNRKFMDVNHDGKINVLDYNMLLNK